jgi:PAS domain S-box-containing protein
MNIMKKNNLLKSQINAKKSLNESGQRYRTIMMSIGDGVISTDAEGNVEMMNPVAEELTGWKEADASGQSLEKIFRIINEKTRKTIENPVRTVLREGVITGLTNHSVLIARDGTEHPVAHSGSPILIEKEEICGVVLVFRDQTEERSKQRKLSESEERFRVIFEKSTIGKSMTLPDGKLSGINFAFADMLGRSVEEMQNVNFSEITHPDDLAESRECIRSLLANERSTYRMEKRYQHKNGTYIWTDVSTSLLRDENGAALNFITSISDISERKKVEEELNASEVRFRIAAETSNDVVYEWDLKDEVRWFGKIDEMLGYAPGEFPRTLEGLGASVYPEDWVRVMAAVQAHLEGRAPYAEDYRVMTKDGTIRWWSARGAVARMSDGTPVLWIGTVTDITERKKTDEALKEAELKFRSIFDKASDGILLAENGSSTFYLANSKICDMLGYTQKEIMEIGLSSIHLEKDLPFVLKQFERLMKNEISLATDIPVLRKDGSLFYADINSSSVNLGGKDYLIGVFRDITERKQAESIIKDNEKRFRELIESLPQLFWTTRVDGPCDYLSKQWVEYTGVPEAEQLGYRWLEQLHPDDRDRTVSEWMEKVKTGESFDIEFRIRRNDGIYHWFKTRAVPMFDADGNIVKWFGSNTDFDEIKKAEEQLINFSKELEQKVEERTKELEAFSYSVSHDLRAPLRHVSGYVELLNKHFQKELSEKGQHYLNSIADSVHLMGKLIDDLLRFSRTGRVEMVRSVIDMNGIIQEVKDSICKDNPTRNIEWVIGKLPSVYGDGSMLQLVWLNLLNNAVKFTGTRANARIEIGVIDEKKEWIFFVKDNGVGFDMAYSHKLFGVFQRLHPTEEYEGTGIGLANVRRIISRHGGRTWAEAQPDKGAIFNFSIPKK